jgi:hypothetical protein
MNSRCLECIRKKRMLTKFSSGMLRERESFKEFSVERRIIVKEF